MASDWTSCKLADACESIDYGLTDSASSDAVGPRFLRITDIVSGHINWDTVPYVTADEDTTSKYQLHHGDIVLARTGASTGASAYIKSPPRAVFASYLVRLKAKAGVEPRFLAYYLKSDEFWTYIRGVLGDKSAQPNASASTMTSAPLRVPKSKDEQRAIAHVLGTLDDKIELNRRMNKTLEEIAQAIFKSWFIDFDPVRRNAARARNQPSPGLRPPSPSGRGSGGQGARFAGKGERSYRGGYDFAGLVETARALRKQQTSAEKIFWELVRGRRFMDLKFRRQHQLGDYVADFYCHEHRLVIELDGGVHRARQKKDLKRDAWMAAQGLVVLRFPNERVMDDPESVLSAIAGVVAPSPVHRPLPLGDGRGEGSVGELDRLFPDDFEDSPLGQIPKGWNVLSLDEIARFLNGLALQKYPPSGDNWLPVIKIAQLRAGHTVGADRASDSIPNDYIVDDGDILFSWSGSLECVYWAGGRGALNQHLFKVTSSTYPKWLCYLAVHQHLDDFRHIAAGKATTMGHIQRHHLTQAKLAIPPMPTLRSMNQIISPILESTWQRSVQSRTLAALRDALLPKLLSGEIRIHNSKAFAARAG